MRWSPDVGAGGWIGERLAPFASGADAVVPAGFDRYVRVLHPAGGLGSEPGVSWAIVAQWAGVPLTPESSWLDVALPPTPRPLPLPWDGTGPDTGAYPYRVSVALTDVLAEHTDPTTGTWAATWEGFGDLGVLPDVPRLHLPGRDYLLRHGDVAEMARLPVDDPWPGHPPNLWWAADTSWCVASEIDLDHTYIGGSAELIDDLLQDHRIEAQPVDVASASITFRVPDWLRDVMTETTRTVLAEGSVTLTLSRGTITATLQQPGRVLPGVLDVVCVTDHGSTSSSTTPLNRTDDLTEVIAQTLSFATLSLAS